MERAHAQIIRLKIMPGGKGTKGAKSFSLDLYAFPIGFWLQSEVLATLLVNGEETGQTEKNEKSDN